MLPLLPSCELSSPFCARTPGGGEDRREEEELQPRRRAGSIPCGYDGLTQHLPKYIKLLCLLSSYPSIVFFHS
ncbi:hypothetical protein Taro_055588 [Colocasia esculenta]|uniref:Uncharacterized protein n=1 Tax=Colocasia esculenta TaxID=4460 RepID=A0A843XRQ0_COLES|nr:hypothetical protein [Colocasia esculenta]